MSADSNPQPRRLLRIFLCHSSDDKAEVRSLYRRLIDDGFEPWLDEEDLIAGQDWQREIPRAVRNSDVVLICLSKKSVNKAGYVQKEIRFALDVAAEQPEGAIFLIPVKLEECSIPQRLSSVQWINLFDGRGYERLIKALSYRADSLGIAPSFNQTPSPAEGIDETSTGSTDPASRRDSTQDAEGDGQGEGATADNTKAAGQSAEQPHRSLNVLSRLTGRLTRIPRRWIWFIVLTFAAGGVAFLVLSADGDKTSPPEEGLSQLHERGFDGLSFVRFPRSEEMLLREAMAPLFSRRCADTFVRAGLRSPAEVATASGVELRPSYDLYAHSVEQLGLFREETRQSFMNEFSGGRAQAATVPPARYGVKLTTDGRARIFLHDSAFLGESFFFGRSSLRDILIHEFIHVGGQPPTPGWLGFVRHDLAGFEHYDDIMSACRSL